MSMEQSYISKRTERILVYQKPILFLCCNMQGTKDIMQMSLNIPKY